ncbi:hypothetical protein E0H73_04910 [Kribbella pittospori]|uniref:YCII-related domain-containing protein n=1 Tax=Kribbella pittospori TaxID=722689 RepID=A0A4R0L306_9ACTN|nr:YciI family protein [Kribbella pittospori]TCC66246.1 hypothetical protein E0H73_04910 [Kribbella pittospori]
MKFLLLIHNNPEALDGLSPEKRLELIGGRDFLLDQVRELRENGELLTILALEPPSETKSVKVTAGTPVISDRPFLETKEFLAGALMVECASMDRALEIAAGIPFAALLPIEVRPVRELDDEALAALSRER